MALPSIKQTLLDEIDKLTAEQQARVLEFTRSLQQPLPPATSGEDLIALVQELAFDPADLAAMETAIAEGCGKIDWDEW
jgi:hypothetical protein